MKTNFVKSRWLFTMLLFVTTMIMPTMMLAKSINPTKPKGDGKAEPYQISTAAELYWFAGLVNGTLPGEKKDVSANAKLMNDITVNEGVLDEHKNLVSGKEFIPWTPIGTSYSDDKAYSGTFEGNKHTISGLYFFNKTRSCQVGLFGYIGAKGKLSDVGVLDSYFQFNAVGGVVCGSNNGVLQNCSNSSTVFGTDERAIIGGVCGYGYGDTTKNCYYLSGTATRGIGGKYDVSGKAEERSKEQFKSGEVAWLLNGSTSVPTEGSTLAWYQKLGENGDEYPVLTPKDGNTVYNNYYTCSDKQVNIFSNTEANAHEKYDKHDKGTETLLANGLYSFTCKRCQANFVYIKDFCGIKDKNIELTVEPDGSYTAAEPVDINDNTPYNSPVDFTATTLNYTRNYLGADQWQAVYVPFEANATDWTDKGITVASINNFHEYEKKDGSGYETVLEVKKATSGAFEANTPYLLRTKDNGSKTITINNAKLHKASSETYYCMSMTRQYDFTGIYTRQSGLGQDGSSVAVYALNKQGLIAPLDASKEVGAQRWYLTVSNRNGSNISQASKSRSINIDEVGEGATTAIKGIQVITNNEADNTSLNGIYDLQGRKLSKEPTHGIYIKNGKKYVK